MPNISAAPRCVAVRVRYVVLWCVVVGCGALCCGALRCVVLWCVAVCCGVLRCGALRCCALCCGVLGGRALCCGSGGCDCPLHTHLQSLDLNRSKRHVNSLSSEKC